MNVNQIPAAQQELVELNAACNAAKAAYDADPNNLTKKEAYDEAWAKLDKKLQAYTGPGVGLVFDDKAGTLNIAEGWSANSNGDLVPTDSITGPGV